MFTYPHRQATQPRTPRNAAARLRRLAAALATIICGLLASAAAMPAALARVVPPPGGPYSTVRIAPLPATTTRVVTVAGMAGWQITLIALGAALVGAAAALVLDRSRTAHRAASATSA